LYGFAFPYKNAILNPTRVFIREEPYHDKNLKNILWFSPLPNPGGRDGMLPTFIFNRYWTLESHKDEIVGVP
jgi:hypothetical protein